MWDLPFCLLRTSKSLNNISKYSTFKFGGPKKMCFPTMFLIGFVNKLNRFGNNLTELF